MSYISFDKNQMINLEFSLLHEQLRTNRAGAYACTTIAGCNTRKYHGLLVCPQPGIDDDNHVLLSGLDETIIQNDEEFNLGIRRYKGGTYNPRGHKYIRMYEIDAVPRYTYRVGGVILTKEILFASRQDRIMIRYKLIEAHSPTRIRFKPFTAFRNVHFLTMANFDADTSAQNVKNGIKMRLYKGYTPLFMQFSKEPEYVHAPDWYYQVEYQKEIDRGYEAHEDLFVPGYFEMSIKKGESIIFTASTEDIIPAGLGKMFQSEMKNRIPRDNFENCLRNSADQLIVERDGKTQVVAGYPYFGRFSRDTLIALPGLTLSQGKVETCKSVINSMINELKDGLFPNILGNSRSEYNSIDAPLWFFWTLQQMTSYTRQKAKSWNDYSPALISILESYKNGTHYGIHMLDNGLISGGRENKALTWMDAIIDNKPVTPRMGCPVEVNALWYNAVCFALEIASDAGDHDFVNQWESLPEKIAIAFNENFWLNDRMYLADYVNNDYKDVTMRPNQVFATSLEYSPLSEERRKAVISAIKRELLTDRGLRTLSPQSPDYIGVYFGDAYQRDMAYHQGSVFPWLLGHFTEGYLKIHGRSGLAFVRKLFLGFEQEIMEHGLGSISEIYDGDPPHRPAGAISQAWSIGELLRMGKMIEQFENNNRI
ncbi:MAG: amylo-alpha-1,6-glucosidase [Bacteroidales bacterium]|nr:amylo-alpha-1,6-glucosidase [Bacteroidales bacterium]